MHYTHCRQKSQARKSVSHLITSHARTLIYSMHMHAWHTDILIFISIHAHCPPIPRTYTGPDRTG